MNKWSELFVGLLFIIVPIVVAFYSQTWGAWNFWTAAGEFFKGGLFWVLVMIGVLFVLLGLSDLRQPATNASRPAPRPVESAPVKRTKK